MAKTIPLSELSGSGATRELHETIRQFNETTTKQTRQLLILTWVIAVLTTIMTIGVGLQIYLAWKAFAIDWQGSVAVAKLIVLLTSIDFGRACQGMRPLSLNRCLLLKKLDDGAGWHLDPLSLEDRFWFRRLARASCLEFI